MNRQEKKKDKEGIIKSVFVAHFILVLHILVIASIGFLVLFFRGIVIYMPWIFLGGTAAVAASCYILYNKMKKEGKSLKEMLSLPVFKDRTVEVSFLGGLASLKVGNPDSSRDEIKTIDAEIIDHTRRLEEPLGDLGGNSGEDSQGDSAINVKELTELVRLLDNNLITNEEYNKAKEKIFNP
jgi:hypothetical protein